MDPGRITREITSASARSRAFSAVAYYSASMVMIAQKTQARRDQAREKADALHREDLAQTQTAFIQANTVLTEDVQRLTQQIHRLMLAAGKPVN